MTTTNTTTPGHSPAAQPAPTRSVTIHLDADQQTTAKETTGGPEFYKALGYLSTWNHSIAHVDIYPDGATDMLAVYRHEPDGLAAYVIGAVWHGDHYGFHS